MCYLASAVGAAIAVGNVDLSADSTGVGGALAGAGGGSGQHVKYLVEVKHGNDTWQLWKR